MITVTEFKTRQNLSDSQFKRVRALAEKNVGQAVTVRVGASTWQVTDERALMDALAEYNGGSLLNTFRPVPEPLTESIDCEIVPTVEIPSSQITLLNNEQNDVLSTLATRFAPKPFQAAEMNGGQTEIVNILGTLVSTSDAMKAENERLTNDIATRRESTEIAKQAITGLGREIQSHVENNRGLHSQVEELSTVESDLKKQLLKLAQSLQ